jgi:hypothetical protein
MAFSSAPLLLTCRRRRRDPIKLNASAITYLLISEIFYFGWTTDWLENTIRATSQFIYITQRLQLDIPASYALSILAALDKGFERTFDFRKKI